MKNHSTRTLWILVAAVALAAPLALAGDGAKVVGTWDVAAVTPEGDLPGVLTIAETDGALEATMDMGGMDRPIEDAKVDGKVFTMTVIYDGSPYEVEMTVDGDSMEGTYTGAAAAGDLTATRQK
jgi:hypothetical protein